MNKLFFYCVIFVMAGSSLFSQNRPMDEQQAGILAKKYYHEMGKTPQRPQQISPQEHGTEAMQQQSMIGHTANEAFGISVASAGDVNGDGYTDILVGAPRYETYKGRVYLYFGGNQINNTADVIFTGEFENDNFGWSVASAGDMNGDGFADMLVGAYGYGGGEGKAYVFYGGTVIDYSPDVAMYGGVSNSFLGTSVAGAGDVNGDGYADVIVGANGAVGNSGRAYIYYGGEIGNGVADVSLSGDAGYFGSTVAGISDINGDGYADVAVGEHPYNANTGGVYIFHGSASMDNTADLAIMGNNAGSFFGKAIAAGDVNGDGYPDIVIGSYGYSTSAGIANVYNGGPNMDPNTDLTLWGEANNGCFGSALACSDINSDGYSDIIVGAFGINSNKGKVFGYWGGAHPDNSPDIKIDGEAAGNFFGSSVASAGDLNLDGNEDFICGAYFYGGGRGKIYLYKNSLAGYDIPDMSIAQAGAGRLFGYTVSNSGDVNGDGFDDILVGAPGAEQVAGNAYLYFGGPSMDNVSDLTFTGDSSYYGSIMAGKGDINGDGISDVVISDYNYDRCRGKVYVYLGGQFIDNISDYTMTGDSIYRYFGYALDKSGDVNGDGYNDLVVSGPGSAGSYGNPYVHSFIYIYRGSSLFSTTAWKTVTPTYQYYMFGTAINCSGDFNGDGINDIAIGEPYALQRKGEAWIVFGGIYNLRLNLFMTDDSTSSVGDQFGYTLSSGDVNGDGYDDLLVGSPNSYQYDGRVSVFLGGVAMDCVKDYNLRGESYDAIAYTLDGSGDVNGDGYNDIMTTALCYGNEAGRVLVYFGGAVLDTNPDIVMTNTISADFGNSCAFAGDQNGDGMTDILVGNPDMYSMAPGSERAYVYLSSAPKTAPRIVSVRDILADQGGKVNLRWVRSGYDAAGSQKTVSYAIDRSPKPVNGIYAWETIASVTGDRNVYYNYTASLPSDSMTGNPSPYYFRVTARLSVSGETWRSNILSGYAVDNLSPVAVKSFIILPVGAANRLSWQLNTEPDMKQYLIYRNSTNTIDPATATAYAVISDSAYTDNTPLQGESFYFVAAQDIHRNIGPVTNLPAPNAAVNLSAFIEGFYNEQTDEQIADTIKVYLCSTTAPYEKIDSATALLSTAGAASIKFFNAVTGNYYLVINHRNSIETWSKLGGEAVAKGSSINYNFSLEATQAFGNNLKQKGSRWCLYSGDANQDGIVDFGDLTLIDNDSYNFMSGYLVTDVNGDQYVDFGDLTICDNNSYNFVQVIKPGGAFRQPAMRGILKTKMLPQSFSVSDSYPNPFNPSTKIDYALPKDSRVNITLYSILGEKVMEVVNTDQRAGYYTAHISMNQFASGTYLVRIIAGDNVQTKKIILAK